MTAVNQAYLVCASQRSGSTLLVASLAATGVAGRPAEYFEDLPDTGLPPQSQDWFSDYAGPDPDGVRALLHPAVAGRPDERSAQRWRDDILDAGTTPNGVWGGKLMWNQTPLLIEHASGLDANGGLRTAIRALLGVEPTYILVNRDDVAEQAVSMWRAVQTQTWVDDPSGGSPTVTAGADRDDAARYHAGAIAHLAAELAAQQQAWDRWFRDEAIDPIRVEFAELVRAPQATTASVLTALGLDPDLAPPPPLKRQGDGRSAEWVRRYRADAEAYGYPLTRN
ncbi:Stf0 family sulfotransferase [Williamsia maris]|uniref:Trehalose 2-sulfotransferase n=1 Tax=Williamsia maris TaxID=72806 RepID=A0ABT1H8T4_9NOCA|nr:Stf0 family sulfotransferase [Williamsia maris]MCP2174673.1 LPS sulfotransferase NodH [Williamsia maris]